MSIEDKLKNAETVDIFSDLTEEEKRAADKQAQAAANFFKAVYDNMLALSFTTVRDELLEHGDVYNGLLTTVKSVLDDWPNGERSTEELAEAIVKRIIGED